VLLKAEHSPAFCLCSALFRRNYRIDFRLPPWCKWDLDSSGISGLYLHVFLKHRFGISILHCVQSQNSADTLTITEKIDIRTVFARVIPQSTYISEWINAFVYLKSILSIWLYSLSDDCMIVQKKMKELTTNEERRTDWKVVFPSELRPRDLSNTSL
jgi:hypothetical protein